MSKEDIIKYCNDVPLSNFDEKGYLKPYGYQCHVEMLVYKHLKKSGIGLGEKLGGFLYWVIISMSIEVVKQVSFKDSIHGITWHVNRRGPIFRRDFEFYNEKNELIFHGGTFSVLIDVNKRSIFTGKELPFELYEDNIKTTINAIPNFNAKLEFKEIGKCEVLHSMIDPLGHVNNNKYGEIAYNYLGEDNIKKSNAIKRIDMFFHSEMSINDVCSVKKYEDVNVAYIQIYTGKKNFSIKYIW